MATKSTTKERLEGAPAGSPAPYPGQERFTDGDFKVYDGWTAKVALRALLVPDDASLTEKRKAAQAAEENCTLPPEGLNALRRAGLLRRRK